MARKDLLDIASLPREEIELILDQARPFKDIFRRSVKKVPTLNGKTVLMLFYEPSTRTSSSFEVAAKRLSADVTNFDLPRSSITKGESVMDTLATLEAMGADYIVVRHKMSGFPKIIARNTKAAVLNAGDGAHAHPTQALLDAFTVREVHPESAGKKILIAGDILHSRVARTTCEIFRKLDIEVGLLGPSTLMPRVGIGESQRFGTFDDALAWGPDVVYLLRVQMERQDAQFFPSLREYHRLYGLTDERLGILRQRGTHLMHPGPVNRGVEVTDAGMDYELSLINQQVQNGVATRMAALWHLKPEK